MDEYSIHDSEFKNIWDFPLIYVSAISIIKPEEVPPTIPYWKSESLETLPTAVVEYFIENPSKNEMAHSDDFIYKRPWAERANIEKSQFSRRYNLRTEVINLMEKNQPVKQYFDALEKRVGQEVPGLQALPGWEMSGWFEAYKIQKIPNTDEFWLRLEESDKRTNGSRVSEIKLFCRGLSSEIYGTLIYPLLQVGHIEYEGRLHQK